MSATVLNAVAADVATLERLVDVPEAPFGFGTDLSCVTDLHPEAREVDPFSRLALGEALVRRLTTQRNTLPDDPGYGIDLRARLNRGMTRADVQALAGAIRGEAEKDDRVAGVVVTVTPDPIGSRLGVRIHVTPEDPQIGEFDLTLAVTSAEVLMEAIA
jgi:hypothetical protein